MNTLRRHRARSLRGGLPDAPHETLSQICVTRATGRGLDLAAFVSGNYCVMCNPSSIIRLSRSAV
jgi:hypothetical protein